MVKTEKKSKKEDENFFGILFFLSTIYISIIAGAYSVLKDLSSNSDLGWQVGLPVTIFSMVLLGIMIVVGFYLMIMILIGIAELKSYYFNLEPNQIKIRNKLRQMVLSAPSEIFSIGLSLATFLTILLLVYFNTWFAVIVSFIYYLSFIILVFARKTRKEFVSSMTIGEPKPSCKIYIALILILILSLSILYILFGTTIFNFSKFNITQDKQMYTINESVYIKIYSQGIIKPIPTKITYSNKEIPLDYIKDVSFPSAPIYIKINYENLTEAPYNSYVQVQYYIPNSKYLLLRTNLTQSEFIPVIKS